ncbi:Alpha/beta hydrolase fold-1 [Usnea florida]
MPSKPTFVLVPGNFLPPAYYASTAKLLESHGFQTRLITIPRTGSKLPLTSNEPDILAVRQVLEELSESGRDIIVVAHSYGSIPTCEAAQGFGHQERLKLGKTGGIIRIVFVAAWLLQEGESPPTVIERYKMEAPWARFEGGNVFADDPASSLHSDTPEDVAAYWSSYTTHSDLTAFATPLKYPAWRHNPTTYLVCELDRCILPDVQRGMVASTEGVVKTVQLPSGHMPMLSMPEKFVDILEGEAGEGF